MMTVTAETSVRRGRHRRPRPRKVLFAVGGLALAAGALSLVRMAPDSGSSGVGTAEAEARQDPGTDTTADASDHAVAAVAAAPRVSPSSTSAMGGESTTPALLTSPVPLHTATTSPGLPTTPGTTTIPVAPNTPAPAATNQPPTPTASTPRPTPTTPSPAPKPSETELCVPAIGLCVDPLTTG
ncbi:hypothetical protein [Streptomyces sp. TLI_185]|uniref:hypothetical protein n=1 Tax=Streptomyces sp. TLI_185 TaxID=2485151 RepID=UPI000FC14FBB|nr:hypothetical protein [Streptomyces sp. TLI_185]RPF35863.1 hypothetical protein EDD92_5888 [Streptomyces sp. TLI_185]